MNAAELLSSAVDIIMPPPKRTAGQWADANRTILDGPKPGPWRTDLTPFWWPVYDAFENPDYGTVVVVCGSQMGKTEMALNVMGHRMDDGPMVPCLYIGPKEGWVKTMSDTRFAPMIRQCPGLYLKLRKGQADKTLHKSFAGVSLTLGTSGSATDLAGQPYGLVIIDERDRMDDDVGKEGDPVELARGRVKNYPGSKIMITSTPTIEGASAVWAHYEEGTLGKWAWPCPHCHEFFVPTLALLTWPDKATPQEAKKHAAVHCPHCGAPTEQRHRFECNVNGRYQYHVLDERGDHKPVPEAPPNDTASFWASGLASPWQSFGEVASLLVKAYRSRNQNKIQGVVNVQGGELFRMEGDAPSEDAVAALRWPYRRGQLDPGAALITAGVDVQKDGIYFVVRAWGFYSESWLVDWGFIWGQTEYADVWMMLARQLQKEYGGRHVDLALIDEGYRPGNKWKTPVHMVRDFCARHQGFALPAKGVDGLDRTVKPVKFEYTPAGAVNPFGLIRINHNPDDLKSWVHSRLTWPADQPGAFHLPEDVDEDYCKQIVNEEVVLKPSGRRVWVETGPNHYLDCECLARAGAVLRHVDALPAPEDAHRQADKADDEGPADDFIGAGEDFLNF